jgi:hypothetical protein
VKIDSMPFGASIRPDLISEKMHRNVLASERHATARSPYKGLDEYWRSFYSLFPRSHGRVQFSQPAFNDSMDEALLYWEVRRADLDGGGEYLLLTRAAPNRWKIVFVIRLWVW